MKMSVLIVSYRRPQMLCSCLAALVSQVRLPDSVVVAGAESDPETHAVVQEFARLSPFTCIWCSVPQPGVVYQTNAGLDCCDADIVVFTNDDAVPFPDWLQRLESNYEDATVGAVGGRDIIHAEGGRILDGQARSVGIITWFGRVHGNHHLSHPHRIEVDLLKGVNMSCRRQLVGHLDTRMVPVGPAHHWELDACLQIQRQGKRLVYDPEICVDHYHGSRPEMFDPEFVYMANHNLTFNLAKNLSSWRRLVFLVYTFIWGDYPEMGLGVFCMLYLKRLMRCRDIAFARYLGPSLRGKLDALQVLGKPQDLPQSRP